MFPRADLAVGLKALQEGDALVVWKLDRLGRSLRDLIGMLDDLRGRGVRFQSLTEAIDTETPTGRAMWQMLGILAELERYMIAERTRVGAAVARERGVKFRRKPKLTPHQTAYARKEVEKGQSVPMIAKTLGVERTTIYRALQRD